ncbi:carbon storage regulator [Pseudomonas syringae]|uniref:carbon storage regulator n=2 Tax=Pseudomonas syringae TaxID=317 RepID=UPI0009B3167D|nr:carbon storage regulator [Pseudomonas syringae]
MLLLTRREGENIIIGDQIQIQILSVSKDPEHVRIGVESLDVLAVQCSDVSSGSISFFVFGLVRACRQAGPCFTSSVW